MRFATLRCYFKDDDETRLRNKIVNGACLISSLNVKTIKTQTTPAFILGQSKVSAFTVPKTKPRLAFMFIVIKTREQSLLSFLALSKRANKACFRFLCYKSKIVIFTRSFLCNKNRKVFNFAFIAMKTSAWLASSPLPPSPPPPPLTMSQLDNKHGMFNCIFLYLSFFLLRTMKRGQSHTISNLSPKYRDRLFHYLVFRLRLIFFLSSRTPFLFLFFRFNFSFFFISVGSYNLMKLLLTPYGLFFLK